MQSGTSRDGRDRGIDSRRANRHRLSFATVQPVAEPRVEEAAGVQGFAGPADAAYNQKVEFFKERESGLRFPISLFGARPGLRQEAVLGGGAYHALMLSVYGVVCYIDVAAAAASPAVRRFKGMSPAEMRENGVWDTLIHCNDFEKSLLLKLALPVSAGRVVAAMRDQWDLSAEEKAVLCESALRHAHRIRCTTGTELMFTALDNGNVLQMRLNGELVETLHFPGLANSIFRQYFGTIPVSPGLKQSVVEGLSAALNGRVHLPTRRPRKPGAAATHAPLSQAQTQLLQQELLRMQRGGGGALAQAWQQGWGESREVALHARGGAPALTVAAALRRAVARLVVLALLLLRGRSWVRRSAR
ncbi:hypothetical protein JKP88DRAFT_279859 [Tribonema minus]|uniref:Chalcone isomerase domain-containing protein n=1 Tax=Tribonema minus TaxID=303371 RepID=A0A836CCL7_9STRA|nr:hypothetical protein JKP88DRAFT_279859 [Tribonema minus]